jgi:hypothetical protein
MDCLHEFNTVYAGSRKFQYDKYMNSTNQQGSNKLQGHLERKTQNTSLVLSQKPSKRDMPEQSCDFYG